jgi:5-methylthioribose kinase
MSKPDTRVPLPGGVSCDVFIERDVDGREIVVKQALPKLKVAADWRANPARSTVEVRALQALGQLLGANIVPAVLWEDAVNHRFAMRRIDPRLRNWKNDLMSGHVATITAARVGELLGLLHTKSASHAEYAIEFSNRDYFEELRIDPFFTRIAQRNPTLAPYVSEAIAALRASGETLVHGDYSPKNLLVDGAAVVILDCEVAHWGNPRFDVAFCLAHLLLKGRRRDVVSQLYANAAYAFLSAYRSHGFSAALDAMLVRILGCLLLARLEGDSPVDYRDQLDVVAIKSAASRMIVSPLVDVSLAIEVYFDKA